MEKKLLVILIVQNIIYFLVFVVMFVILINQKKKIKKLKSLYKKLHEVNISNKTIDLSGVESIDEKVYFIDDVTSSLNESLKITLKSESIYQPHQLNQPIRFDVDLKTDDHKYLIFDEYSLKKLHLNLEWGISTIKNQVEQGGILLGHISQYEDEIYCFVEDILLAKTKGNPTFVEFTSDMWKEMQRELLLLNEKRKTDNKLIILGWFHTHPNNLPVFMSGTDMETQRLNFPLDWQVSLVMNPHKKEYQVFFGKSARKGYIVFPHNE